MRRYVLLVLAMAAAVSGCGMSYTPKPLPISGTQMTGYERLAPLNLVNGQAPGSKIDVPAGSFTIRADLYDYSEQVISLIKDHLIERGGKIAENAPHTLRIAVVDVWLIPRFGAFKCDVNLSVAVGKEPPMGIEASSQSWDYESAIDQAITQAAEKVLNHEKVMGYLKGGKGSYGVGPQ